jgi:hypothetical protein
MGSAQRNLMSLQSSLHILSRITGDAMQTWAPHIIRLLEEPEIGVLLGATALLLGVVSSSYHGAPGSWKLDVVGLCCPHCCWVSCSAATTVRGEAGSRVLNAACCILDA